MSTVCITLNEDGTYGVYREEEETMAEEGMPEAAPQTFETAEEACQAAIQMLGSEEPMIEGEDTLDFEKGFAGIRGG